MSIVSDQDVQSFEAHRRSLIGLAYRMLGSRAEAEDVVQDAYLRWHAADRTAIVEPRSYLGTVVTRLCLDRMKSATARRELYVGQWLPEPVVDEAFDAETAGDLGREEAACRQLAARVSRPAGRVLPLRPRRGIGSPRRSGKPSIRATRRRWPGSWRKTRCSIPTAAASAPRR
jgi:DNA-directed RNA polymerase specialized sigma24 family protein